jgi:hypothetical protein
MQARDATLWIHLIGLLKKKELLPVVVFTFSKRRCEENAASMPNTDLCSAAEKSEVHVAIERSLTRLKGEFCFSCLPVGWLLLTVGLGWFDRIRQAVTADHQHAQLAQSRYRSPSWWFASYCQRGALFRLLFPSGRR